MLGLVSGQSFDVVGLPAGSETRLDAVGGLVRAIRRASRKSSGYVMAGGPIFVERPDLVTLVGADATARDGRAATTSDAFQAVARG